MPEAPDNPGQPLLNQPTEPSNTQPQQPEGGYYGGKYKTLEDWEAATRASEQEGSRLANEVKQLQEKTRQYEEALRANLQQPRGDAARNVFEELEEIGIPRDKITKAIDEIVAQRVQPLYAASKAEQELASKYPEYQQVRSEVYQFVSSNPELTQRFNKLYESDPIGATEWAMAQYERAHKKDEPAQPVSDPRSAALPANRAPERGDLDPNSPDVDRLNKGLEYARTYGDARPFLEERLKGIVTEEHLNQEVR